jgi:glycosyltransferase involved in cell wall biosynthesis
MMKMTIIIPCYNAEKWIRQCVRSAMNQTHKNTEVILVDNESTDNSLAAARELQLEFPNLIVDTAPNIYKYSYQEPVEKALSISTGDYFTILGSDDFIHPNYVENIFKFIEAVGHNNVLAMQSPILGVDNLAQNSTGLLGHTYKDIDEFKSLLFQKCPVTTPSVVFAKSLYTNKIVRWHSDEYLGASDYEMYFNLADNGIPIFPIGQWLGYYYRWHEGQSTWGMHSTGINFDEIIKEKWRKKWKMT